MEGNGIVSNEEFGKDGFPLLEEREEEVVEQMDQADSGTVDASTEQILLNAKQLSTMSRAELEANYLKVQESLAKSQDSVHKLTKEKNEANGEVDRLNRTALALETRTANAEKQGKAHRLALAASYKGSDVSGARKWRKENAQPEPPREEIPVGHPLHPDYNCNECGRRVVGSIIPNEKGLIAKMKFDSLRELAAILELKHEGNALAALPAMRNVAEKVASRSISSQSLRMAYEKGLCLHAMHASDMNMIAKKGVNVKFEDESVSNALTEVLGGERVSRKPLVVFVPTTSVVIKSFGGWKEMECVTYEEEEDLKKKLIAMETASTLPKSIVILLKMGFAPKTLTSFRAYVETIAKKTDVAVYIGSDLLPAAATDIQNASVKANLLWLMQWRSENPATKNLIVISATSALIWSIHPLTSLFGIAKKETKALFEDAIKHIVYGTAFPFEKIIEEKKVIAVKRDGDGGAAGPSAKRQFKRKSPDGNPLQEMICRVCNEKGHGSWCCPKKTKKSFE